MLQLHQPPQFPLADPFIHATGPLGPFESLKPMCPSVLLYPGKNNLSMTLMILSNLQGQLSTSDSPGKIAPAYTTSHYSLNHPTLQHPCKAFLHPFTFNNIRPVTGRPELKAVLRYGLPNVFYSCNVTCNSFTQKVDEFR